jgi:hypothetical protein
LAAAWRRRCGGGAQRDGGSALAAARWLRRWRQRDIVTSAAIVLLFEILVCVILKDILPLKLLHKTSE